MKGLFDKSSRSKRFYLEITVFLINSFSSSLNSGFMLNGLPTLYKYSAFVLNSQGKHPCTNTYRIMPKDQMSLFVLKIFYFTLYGLWKGSNLISHLTYLLALRLLLNPLILTTFSLIRRHEGFKFP